MKNDIELENYDGELYTIIDNQKIDYIVKKIIKNKIIIEGDCIINHIWGDSIEINHNIFREDSKGNKTKIFKGQIEVLYNNEIIDFIEINNGLIYKKLLKNFEIGIHEIILFFKGNKYYEDCYFPIIVQIEKRNSKIIFHQKEYKGYPNEIINISGNFLDEKNKEINEEVLCTFNNKDFKVNSKNGFFNFDLYIPDQFENDCTNNKDRINILKFRLNSDSYNDFINNEIKIYTNKLETQVNISSLTSNEDKTLNISGNVISKNNVKISNVKHGNIEIYLEEKLLPNIVNINNLGFFSTNINYEYIIENLSNNYNGEKIFDTNNKRNILVTIDMNKIPNSIKQGEEIFLECSIKTKNNLENVSEGMVKFIILNENKKEIKTVLSELNENGIATGYLNMTKKGTYYIYIKYYGFYEYKNEDSIFKKIMVI